MRQRETIASCRAYGLSRLSGILRALRSRGGRASLRPLLYYSILIFFNSLILSCSRYELELYYDGRADAQITYDWMSRFGEYPDGMTLLLAKDGDRFTYIDATNNVDYYDGRLQAGTYMLTAMNRTFAEYGTMQFYQRNSHDQLYAVSNTWTQQQEQAWDEGRIYMEEPERIGVAVDTFYVPESVGDLTFYNYRDHYDADTVHIRRHEVIQPMTTTLYVRCKVINIQYMRAVEGYIAGMADGFLLNQWWRRTRTGTIKMDSWRVSRVGWEFGEHVDDNGQLVTDSAYVGWINTSVATFGLPHGRELLRQRTPESNIIVLHFTLIDGTTIDFSYPVGLLIRYEGDDGEQTVFRKADVSLTLDLELVAPFIDRDITLPYAQPDGTGQFDAVVNPWDDAEDIDITF